MSTIPRRRLDACILRSGPWFVRLRTRTPRLAEVLGGNVFSPGDWVELPPGRAWPGARNSDRRGNTRTSPLELWKAYDGASASWLLAPRPGAVAGPPAPEADDEAALLAREVSALLSREAEHGEAPFNVRARPAWNAHCA